MVRRAGMSRGCATCRKRRVKCDERLPCCSQCARGRRSCPGPVPDRIFLVTHADNPRKCSRQEEDAALICPPSSDLLQKTTGWNGAASHEGELYSENSIHKADNENDTDLRIMANPTSTELTETQLVAKFISFFAKSGLNKIKSNNNSWMAMLPAMLSGLESSRRVVELRSSVLAASFALCSSIRSRENNKTSTSLEVEARKLYLTSLKQQRVKMLLGSHSAERIIPLVEDVAIAVILAYYEVISPTFERAYFQHILGAKALLEMIGPSNCRGGYYHQLFRTVRLYMVHISITTQSLTSFSSEEWTETPFSVAGKTRCDRIVDILLQLPRLWLPAYPRDQDSILIGFIEELKGVWTPSTQSKSNTDMQDATKTTYEIIDIRDIDFVPGPSTALPDSEAAIAISFYSLAWILILDRIRAHYPEKIKTSEQLLLGHCDAVLRACTYIEQVDDGCGFIRVVFPLRSVALLSPSLMQREYAKGRLDLWRLNKGLGGVCAVAVG